MIIECNNLVKTYQQDGQDLRAVDNASFSVEEGAFLAILGHSGSGKTTLLSLIGGLACPDQGSILTNGVDCWQQSEAQLATMRNQTIGFIFQFGSLIPTLTAIENVLLPLSWAGAASNPAENIPLARELLDQVGLADKENAFPAHLSGGQQRRVAIARAFINRPSIILADEPTGNLNSKQGAEIMNLFKQLNEEGVTIIQVTHSEKNATYGSRIIHLLDGRSTNN